ncbi:hypothetical protein [Leptospira sarikeiensis]|uniref:Lipoprotein n=1 Tax=Leptospira sarikeiensis TaxID=2484943 RepID=A0A4R9KEE9_9LEPT|nr:hypothetical protein [Leptospira sarikeiensis]TGL64646.1 hypothetical protein EHQ64_02015 [Leptospira sarikeiensis]
MNRYIQIVVLLVCLSCVNCGLVLTGTDAGREFAGLSEEDKTTVNDAILAIVSGGAGGGSSGFLQFNPNPLVITIFAYQDYNVSIRSSIPSGWSNNAESVLSINLVPKDCPSISDDISLFTGFSGSNGYAAQDVTMRFTDNSPSTCTIQHLVSSSTPDIDLPTGFNLGTLSVTIQ